ncbi:hypothetical protein BOTBODRAFT_640664 [Botryobasidium botryosum FD-172 SS1]|uniref:Uncharacterized protein n=1 Tax=Botryobasidium botryosum (strain FD-172 SS1) TaxID=930990 RepID=A0A067M366_BOTB1|nr:hypothetical protein BOTBODRAFT_640664 [Botryobasidium botryosum FD-172 SS1]
MREMEKATTEGSTATVSGDNHAAHNSHAHNDHAHGDFEMDDTADVSGRAEGTGEGMAEGVRALSGESTFVPAVPSVGAGEAESGTGGFVAVRESYPGSQAATGEDGDNSTNATTNSSMSDDNNVASLIEDLAVAQEFINIVRGASQDIEQISASTASSVLNLAAEISPSGSIGGQAAAKQVAPPALQLTIVDPLLEAYGPGKEPAGPSQLEQAQNSSHLVPCTRAPARTGATIAVPIPEGVKGHTSPRNTFVTEQSNINPMIMKDKKYEQLSDAKKATLEKSV